MDAQIADAVVNQDLDQLQRLADYAREHDPGTEKDIHGKIIKPHKDKWGKKAG